MKLGTFIVPTGIGASIGGFAGDASLYAKKIAEKCKLIVNPNVVNAACFSGITDNMLYVEGYAIDEFFKGNIALVPSKNNKIGVIFDKAIPQNVLNVHINTINAVKTVYGIDVIGYEISEQPAGVNFYIDKSGISMGNVQNLDTLKNAGEKLLKRGAEALAVVCLFPEENGSAEDDYANGAGVDPVGGVEAIISHYLVREFNVPCAHAPAFCDVQIPTEIVDPRCSAEYITPTFLPCILIGLNNAPRIVEIKGTKALRHRDTKGAGWIDFSQPKTFLGRLKSALLTVLSSQFNIEKSKDFLTIDDLDFLIIPYSSIGSIPVLEASKRNIKIYAVKENHTVLNVTPENFLQTCDIINLYSELQELI